MIVLQLSPIERFDLARRDEELVLWVMMIHLVYSLQMCQLPALSRMGLDSFHPSYRVSQQGAEDSQISTFGP